MKAKKSSENNKNNKKGSAFDYPMLSRTLTKSEVKKLKINKVK